MTNPQAHRDYIAPVVPLYPMRPGRSSLDWDAITSTVAPRVPWSDFLNEIEWEQGEHLGLVGPTGQGKTTLLMELLGRRDYIAIFATKPKDITMEALVVSGGYVKMERWENIPADKVPRRVIWPNARRLDAAEKQRAVFQKAFDRIYAEGGWCTVVDEGFYVAEILKLKQAMRTYWTQGRTLGISFVVATQRPAWVPLEMYDGCTHLFVWRTQEEAALRRLASLGGNAETYVTRYLVTHLEKHQCLYINTRTGQMMRTRAPAPYPTMPLRR